MIEGLFGNGGISSEQVVIKAHEWIQDFEASQSPSRKKYHDLLFHLLQIISKLNGVRPPASSFLKLNADAACDVHI